MKSRDWFQNQLNDSVIYYKRKAREMDVVGCGSKGQKINSFI